MSRWPEIVAVIQRATRDEALAEAVMLELSTEYGGEAIYIPARAPLDVEAVRGEVDAGADPDQVCQRHGISKRKFRKLFD